MKKRRLIPILLLKNGWLVQSKEFRFYKNLGNPVHAVRRLSEWAADELIYLDITTDGGYDIRRDDLAHPNRSSFLQIIGDVARLCKMPLCVGGRITSLVDIEKRLTLGADKICINTHAIEDPQFIELAAREFGSQCIVVSIDVATIDGHYRVVTQGGRRVTNYSPGQWSRRTEGLGAGEILLNCIERDGMRCGYDLSLLREVTSATSLPIIACGGVGEWAHFAEALEHTNVDGVAAANIFHFSDQSVYLAKKFLCEQGFNMRKPDLLEMER